MEALLDFSHDFNVALLDQIVKVFYSSGGGNEQQVAKVVLSQFQEHPDAWTRVPNILETSSYPQSKYIGLQILEKLIATRWKVLPEDQRQGIRNFLIALTVKLASDETVLRRERAYLNKLNLVVVQILKQEWPHNWPNFISELVESSKTNLSLCENNMVILKLLSEEVFVFSADQMTQAKAKDLKARLEDEFSEIFKLCSEVLREAQKTSLIKATLETLLKFLDWIPLGYIFETDIIDLLLTRFLDTTDFRNVTLSCLAEITTIEIGPEYNIKFAFLLTAVMTAINKMIPPTTDISYAYDETGDAGQEFILNLALFLCNFLENHLSAVESNTEVTLSAHMYLVKISHVHEREIWRICIEYWVYLLSGLYEEMLGMSIGSDIPGRPALRRDIYTGVLSQLRYVVIERMVKPEEVLVVENDEGEIVREHLKETDTIVLYKTMRELLVYLTHLGTIDTINILREKLSKQADGSEWSWANLNALCWAIGSISGTLNESTEKEFLVYTIKELLSLVELKRGKDNKAVIASDIMYIVGQYPRFLKGHWNFSRVVVLKLFEFMHERHEGVQDMACDTFIKIAQKCGRLFMIIQKDNNAPFIEEILRTLSQVTVDLSPQQMHTFYEAVGYMIATEANRTQQERILGELMRLPNGAWDNLMAQAAQNVDILSQPENVKVLSNVLKTNTAACTSVGPGFLSQLARIFTDMLGLYQVVSGLISDAIAKSGPIASKTTAVRYLRSVKKDILKLMEMAISKSDDITTLNTGVIPPLLDAVLLDYNSNIAEAREPEVLNLVDITLNRVGPPITPQVEAILGAIFLPTLNMINKDFIEYPEHRLVFYKILRSMIRHCFPALLLLQAEQFKLFMSSVFWGIKHTTRDVSDLALNLCLDLINKFAAAEPAVSNPFFQGYFASVVQETFFVLTDTDHKSGFTLQALILSRAFQLVNSNVLTVQLSDITEGYASMPNSQFLQEFCLELLMSAFAHMQRTQIEAVIQGLNANQNDIVHFKSTLRDFLIQMKEFSGDNADLFIDDREAEAQKKEQEQLRAAQSIPGMLKPSQLDALAITSQTETRSIA